MITPRFTPRTGTCAYAIEIDPVEPFIRGHSAVAVWEAIDGERTVDAIRASTGLSTANVRRILRDLRDNHFTVVNGGPGRPTTYRRAAE